MYVFVGGIFHRIDLAWSTQVALVIEVKFTVRMGEGPHTDVEFSAPEEKGLFKVLLDDPIGELDRWLQKTDDLHEIWKYFDSFPLILVGWFDQPQILLAMFLWNPFFVNLSALFLQVFKTGDKLVVIRSLQIRTYDKWSRGGVKHLIIGINERYIVLVIKLETAHQPCLGGDLSMAL